MRSAFERKRAAAVTVTGLIALLASPSRRTAMSSMEVVDARPDTRAGYRVDVSRGSGSGGWRSQALMAFNWRRADIGLI
jgi:hypothetical protein